MFLEVFRRSPPFLQVADRDNDQKASGNFLRHQRLNAVANSWPAGHHVVESPAFTSGSDNDRERQVGSGRSQAFTVSVTLDG